MDDTRAQLFLLAASSAAFCPLRRQVMPLVLVDKTFFVSDAPEGSLQTLAAVRKVSAKLFLAHAGAVAAGDNGKAKKLQDVIVASDAVRLSAVIRAAKKLPSNRRPALEACFAQASQLTFAQPLSEPVYVYAMIKSSGGKRMIHKPGLLRRAQYEIVTDLLRPHLKPRSFQYAYRGVHKAILAAKQSMASGHVYAARLDVRDFYPSFEPEGLVNELPLRKELVEQAVTARHYKVHMEPAHLNSSQQHLGQARLGLPQGASCSPMVAVFCMSKLAWTALPGVKMLNWVDDFLLLATTKGELATSIGKLTNAVGKLPGGNFKFKEPACSHAQLGFDFLNHHLVMDNGTARVRLTQNAIEQLYARMNELDHRLTKLDFLLKPSDQNKIGYVLARKLAYVRGWANAFSECEDVGKWQAQAIACVENDAAVVGLSLKELKGMEDESMLKAAGDYVSY